MTSLGLSRESASQPRPHFSSAPGRKFSTSTSRFGDQAAHDLLALGRAQVAGHRLLVARLHLPPERGAVAQLRHLRSGSPTPGGSILITSAPKSASVLPQNGPAIRRAELEHADAGQRPAHCLIHFFFKGAAGCTRARSRRAGSPPCSRSAPGRARPSTPRGARSPRIRRGSCRPPRWGPSRRAWR